MTKVSVFVDMGFPFYRCWRPNQAAAGDHPKFIMDALESDELIWRKQMPMGR
jgi:hypothetical protein